MKITVLLEGDRELIVKFATMTGDIRDALTKEMHVLALMFEREVKANYLSGPTGAHTLSVRSGALRRSVFTEVQSSEVEVSAGIGYAADVPYAAIHEFGGIIHHPGGTAFFLDQDDVIHFVSNASARAQVLPRTRAHIIVIPERAPMRTAFAAMEDFFKQSLMDAVEQALQ